MVMPPMNRDRASVSSDDVARSEHAEQAGNTHFPGVDVHPHLGELRAEGVPRQLGVGRDVVPGVRGALGAVLEQVR